MLKPLQEYTHTHTHTHTHTGNLLTEKNKLKKATQSNLKKCEF